MELLFAGIFTGFLAGFVVALACYENEFTEKEKDLKDELNQLLEGTADDLK